MEKKEHKGGGNGQVAVAVAVVGCASTKWEKNPVERYGTCRLRTGSKEVHITSLRGLTECRESASYLVCPVRTAIRKRR